MLGNKEIMGANIQHYISLNGLSRGEFAKAIGEPYSSVTDWINAKSYPRIDKIQKMADYFGIEKADLVERHGTVSEQSPYYLNKDTAQIAQQIYDDPDLRALFDAARDVNPSNLKLAAEMLKRLKETNPDG